MNSKRTAILIGLIVAGVIAVLLIVRYVASIEESVKVSRTGACDPIHETCVMTSDGWQPYRGGGF